MNKTILLILDGWGIGNKSNSDGIFNSKTPFYDKLKNEFPNSTLTTFGNDVGLPEGQMGNSEVGHLNIGSGRVIWQQLELINRAFKNNEILNNPTLNRAINLAKSNRNTIHLVGLLSDGGVHSSIEHLKGLINYANISGVANICIHAFLDGRDTDPKSGIHFLKELNEFNKSSNAKIVSVIGRYYAMDRDKRWERVKLTYDLLVKGEGEKASNFIDSVLKSYDLGITDEFVKPISINDNGESRIMEDDVVILFNFRTDRGREITEVLTQYDLPELNMKALHLNYFTMTEYNKTYKNVSVLFENKNIEMTLGEVISLNGLTQIRAAETEKYPHVTFFFSGGREEPFKNETRILIPSPKVATYDLQPEMSALELKKEIVKAIEANDSDFMVVNFANTDMVGYTGVFKAVIKAAETVDKCVEEIVKSGIENGYQFIIIADHGNSEYMINEDGTPNTAHTLNPVPCIIVSEKLKNISISNGKLADIAPTILKMMCLKKPVEMTGNELY